MHYYKFNVADYKADTAHLDVIEHGIYFQLICWYYLDEKQLPLETQVVMRRLSLDTKMLHKLENVLSDFFIKTDIGYFHNRIEQELEKYKTQFAKNRINGLGGGRPSNKTNKNPSGYDNNPQAPLTKNQEPRTNNQEPITSIERVTRATRLPKNWQPTKEYLEFCQKERPELNAEDVASCFKDYWISKAGKDGAKLDWLATWRNWVRNQKSNGKTKSYNNGYAMTDENFDNWLNSDKAEKVVSYDG